MKTRLELSFKGERKYLQGPDIFNETLLFLSQKYSPLDVLNIDFSFHRMARTAVDIYDSPQANLGDPVAVCAYRLEGKKQKVYLYESSDVVEGRVVYNEDEIVEGFIIDLQNMSGVLKNSVAYTDIETWVSLTKALHQRALANLNGKWLFVRGRFPKFVPKSHSSMWCLKIVSNFQNTMTRTELSFGDDAVGEIYFSII